MRRVLLAVLLAVAIVSSSGFFPDDSEWEDFKISFRKSYKDKETERRKRLNLGVNKFRIFMHNSKNSEYKLGVNQFSDMTLYEYIAQFPRTVDIPSNGVPYTAPTIPPPDSYSYAAQGFTSPVQDQGLACSSGWAYATATALQIFLASITGNLNSQTLSAQNLIDCAGGITACTKQVPQTAFDYLTKESRKLFPESEYNNNPRHTQGMCVPPATSTNGKTLKSYSNIENGNDGLLKSVLNYVSPVVIKLNPATFEFMHYKEGVFTQPWTTLQAAHYVTVIGYQSATGTKKGVWHVQNSFGPTWGEGGMMRIEMNPAKPISRSAIFPLD